MSNESIVCAAAAQVLSAALNDNFAILSKPDSSNRGSKDVDAEGVSARDKRFVMEHTSIDSFEDQRLLAQTSFAFFQELTNGIPVKLPEDCYFGLSIPVTLAMSLSRKERQRLQGFLPGWIAACAPLLPDDDRLSFEVRYRGHRLGLHRRYSHPTLNGRVIPLLVAPEGVEDERQKVIRNALRKKMPKFTRYPRRRYLRILVFEDVDMALSNSTLVREAFNRSRLSVLWQMPDFVIYVSTYANTAIEAEFLRTPTFGQGRNAKGKWYMFEEGRPILQDRTHG